MSWLDQLLEVRNPNPWESRREIGSRVEVDQQRLWVCGHCKGKTFISSGAVKCGHCGSHEMTEHEPETLIRGVSGVIGKVPRGY
jgi:hypothetical protein